MQTWAHAPSLATSVAPCFGVVFCNQTAVSVQACGVVDYSFVYRGPACIGWLKEPNLDCMVQQLAASGTAAVCHGHMFVVGCSLVPSVYWSVWSRDYAVCLHGLLHGTQRLQAF